MPKFQVKFFVTERTEKRVTIEADTADAAVEMVESYSFDNDHSEIVSSLDWTVDNVSCDGAPDA